MVAHISATGSFINRVRIDCNLHNKGMLLMAHKTQGGREFPQELVWVLIFQFKGENPVMVTILAYAKVERRVYSYTLINSEVWYIWQAMLLSIA